MTIVKNTVLAAAVTLCLLSNAASAADPVRITFDADDPIGGLAEGATLSDQYAAFGVTFAPNAFSGPGGPVTDWATNTDMTIATSPAGDVGGLGSPSLVSGNVLHSYGGWLDEDGDPSFGAYFSQGVSSFSADFAGVFYPDSVVLYAYNGSTLLGTASSVIESGQFTLSFSSATPITSVVVNNGAYDDWVGVDNITFTAVSAVPEPSTYAMFGLGLGLLGVVRRKRAAKAAPSQ
jgi:hypothetical protein